MVARIIELCARNRFLVLVGVAIATAAALWSVRQAKLDAIPDLGDPQVIVFTEWMGRSPTLVEDQVTYPIVSSLLAAPRVAITSTPMWPIAESSRTTLARPLVPCGDCFRTVTLLSRPVACPARAAQRRAPPVRPPAGGRMDGPRGGYAQ